MTDNTLGTALMLGPNASISASQDPQTTTTGNFTLTLWARMVDFGPAANLISKQSSGAGGYTLSLFRQSEQPYCRLQLGDLELTAPLPNAFSRWVYFAFTVANENDQTTVKLMLDGQLVAQQQMVGPWQDFAGQIVLGGDIEGALYDFRRWDESLTLDSVRAWSGQPLNGAEPNLRSWLPLTGLQPLRDSVTDVDYQALLTQWQQMPLPYVSTPSHALFLDQQEEWLEVSLSDFASSRFTLEFWFQSTHATPSSVLLDYQGQDGTQGICLSDPGNLSVSIGGISKTIGLNLLSAGWHHVALSWHSLAGQLNVYHNGKKYGETIALVGGVEMPSAGTLRLGASVNGEHAHPAMYLADIRWWQTCRTQDEIANNFLNRMEGDEYPLALYWPLDQSEDNEVMDKTSGAHHAQLVGGRWHPVSLYLKPSVAQQLRDLRELAYNSSGTSQGGSGAPSSEQGEPIVIEGVGLSFDISTFMSALSQNLAQVSSDGFALENIDIEAKVLLGTDSSTITLPFAERLSTLDPGHYSTLRFSYTPDDEPAPQSAVVPYLVGATEQFAIAQLNTSGLSHKKTYQVSADENLKGVVLAQYPAHDSVVDASTPVTMVIGSTFENQ